MAIHQLTKNITPFVRSAAIVVISTLLLASVVYAVTTVGSNITTDGNLTVSGNATTTGNFIIGASSWDAPTSTLTVVGNAYINRKATTSDAFWIGTGGTANNINLAGGDLYVQNDTEIDGALYVTGSSVLTGTSTSTGDFVVGSETLAATTTVKIKADAVGGNGTSCVEWVNVEGVTYREYVNGAGTKVLKAGACK